jgi:Flp pilus assembly pilin Flp
MKGKENYIGKGFPSASRKEMRKMAVLDYLRARYLSERAQGMVEYALILAFVVAVCIIITDPRNGVTRGVKNVFSNVTNTLESAGN